MGIKGRLAIGGCSGSALGMLLGAIVGFSIALLCYPLSYQQPIELVTGLLLLFHNVAMVAFWIIGAVVGGAIGSMVGAAVGSALAARTETGRPLKSAKDDLGDHAV